MGCESQSEGAFTDAISRLMSMRTQAQAVARPAAEWPTRWGLDALRYTVESVAYPHRQARMLRAEAAEPAWMHCDLCHGTATELTSDGARACPQCAGLHQRLDMVARAALPAVAAGRTLRSYDFKRPGVPAGLREKLWSVITGESHPRGLLLFGGVGVGKTHIAQGLVLTLCGEYGRPARFIYWPDYLDRIRACFDSMSHSAEQVRATAAGAAGVLVLDDLGAEKHTDWTREEATKLIDMRYREGRPVVVTTNLSPGGQSGTPMAMCDALGERCRSRLYEMCEVVVMGGADHRIQGH